MTLRPPKPCTYPGCGALVQGKVSRCSEHPATNWAQHQKGRNRKQRGYGREWEAARQHVLYRDGYLCQVCLKARRYTPAQEVDHIKPKSKGGTDAVTNLRAICRECHRAKTSREGQAARYGGMTEAGGG